MKVCKQHRTEQPLKYLIALILFCLVLGWAFTDVYGGNVGQDHNSEFSAGGESRVGATNRAPSAVPEPTTLALMALGMGGLAAYRKLKK
jgi:hypothetical protein